MFSEPTRDSLVHRFRRLPMPSMQSAISVGAIVVVCRDGQSVFARIVRRHRLELSSPPPRLSSRGPSTRTSLQANNASPIDHIDRGYVIAAQTYHFDDVVRVSFLGCLVMQVPESRRNLEVLVISRFVGN